MNSRLHNHLRILKASEYVIVIKPVNILLTQCNYLTHSLLYIEVSEGLSFRSCTEHNPVALNNLFSSAQSEDKHYDRSLERISDHNLAPSKIYGKK